MIKLRKVSRVRLSFVLLLVVLALVLPMLSYLRSSPATASSDLVAWWKLDEGSGTTAIDSSGNGNNGTLTNVTYSTQIPPEVSFDDPYSTYFNSSASGRIITTPVSLNNYTEFTMAGWAYPTAADSRASWFGQNDLFEFGFTDGNTLFCYTSKGETSWDFNPSTFLNQWHHITCLATPSQLIVYVDGVNVATASISAGSFGSSGSNFSIGAGAVDGGNSGPFTGYIDDVRVYSRGLSPSEMNSLGTGSTGPTNAPNVSITTPADGAAINSWSPSVNWDSADTCEYKFDAGSWQSADCAQAGADIPAPSTGNSRMLSIQATYDGVATVGTASATFDYDTTNPSAAGTPTVSSPTNDTTPTVSWTASSDSGSGLASPAYTLQWSANSSFTPVAGSNTGNTTSLSPVAGLVDGTWYFRIITVDRAGNMATSAVSDPVVIDATAPSVPGTPTTEALWTRDNTPSYNWTASSDSGAGLAYIAYGVEWSQDTGFSGLGGQAGTTGNTYIIPDGLNMTDGTWYFHARAFDAAGNQSAWSGYATVKVDTTPPVITRAGSASVTVVQGQSYSDAGATAADAMAGDLTEDIVVNNPVNTNTVGTYTVSYNVTDLAGNTATTVTRAVHVVSNADLNHDGMADAMQLNVSSVTNHVTGKSAVAQVDDECSLSDVSIKNQSELGTDEAFSYPVGLLDFTATCGTNGFTTTVTQYYYNPPAGEFVLRKFANGTFKTVGDASISRQTINGIPVLVVSYSVTDGGDLDADGVANGVIVDPAGPAQVAVGLPNTGIESTPSIKVGTFVIEGLLIIAVAVVIRRTIIARR